MGQRILFRASWNYIYCLLLWLKTWSVRGASHHSVFMILVLVKGMKRGGEFKIAFCYLRGLGASPQTNGGWLLYWSLILSNGGGIWELTVSRKWNDDVFSPRFHLLVLCLVYIKGIRRQGESKISCLTPVMESFSSDLLRAIISYWTRSHLESVRHPRWNSSAKIANGLKMSTISAKKLHRRCSTGFQMHLRLKSR